MQLQGKVRREGNTWLIECPDIGAFTEGRRTKADAYRMMADWVQSILDRPDYKVDICDGAAAGEFVMAFEERHHILGIAWPVVNHSGQRPATA